VLGVSPDGAEDHQAFTQKFSLPFPLLSDEDKSVMTAYNAYGEKMMYGKKTIGIIRSTVVIGPDGKILKHWKKVPNAETHPEKVLEFVSSLSE
jgi:peroxiredoxin Q/BCP